MEQVGVPPSVPRPPSYAWDWLQRSRPVLQALAQRLTGQPPSPGFVEEIRAAFAEDPFVHAVVVDTIADVAFAGRVPRRRPAGVTWDRGLSWWAATLAGTTRRDFEAGNATAGEQSELFPTGREHGDTTPGGGSQKPADADVGGRQATAVNAGPDSDLPRGQGDGGQRSATAPRPSVVVTLERRRLANALRTLIANSGDGDVPADALRQLIHDLESLE